MSESRVLIVEDDRALRETIADALDARGYETTSVGDGITAAQTLRSSPFDVVLLDIGLPFVDGWSVLSQLEGTTVPSVIVISARGEESDKIKALDMGADDYLTKPFGIEELLARVRAVRRRVEQTYITGRVEADDVTVDLQARSAIKSGREIRLSPTEWELLALLTTNAGQVVEHRRLLSSVWGPEYVGDRNYLRTFIQRLRRKLETDPANPTVIVTVGRLGYRLGAPRPPR